MKKFFAIVVLLGALGTAGVFFQSDLKNIYLDLTGKYQELKNIALGTIESESQKEVIAPPPLRAEKEAAVSNLTKAGVIRLTNDERKENGRSSLRENQRLNDAANMKLEDMFQGQYFDHVSPDGDGPAELAEGAGYEYIMVGENLALGNFEDDAALVQAWMESPGHRENILQPSFSEIGVAVGKGTFEGKTVWLAVQEFGRPLSTCPKADANLKIRIEKNTKNIDSLKEELSSRREEIEKNRSSDEYSQKEIREYNDLVKQYNELIEETEVLISRYNRQVKEYNKCVSQ